MPDPFLQLKAIAAAAGASALLVLALGRGSRIRKNSGAPRGASRAGRPAGAARLNSASVLAIGLGLSLGCQVLQLPLSWPPANGLDRFLTIVLPAVIAIELIAGFQRVPRWLAWILRMSLAAAIGRILLHGSVYLDGHRSPGTAWQAGAALALGGALLAAEWGLLGWLSDRRAGISIPLVLSQAALCGGVTVMMAGYVAGGEAALPTAAALVGASLAARWLAPSRAPQGTIGIGLVGLFGLLFIGRFFGGLSTASALTVLLAPLLCWATEIPPLSRAKPWRLAAIRLALTAVPLIVVLAVAKRDFERDMAPLLGPKLRGSFSNHPKTATNRTLTCRDRPVLRAQNAASAQPKLRKKKLAKPYLYRPGNPSRRIARL